MTEISEYLEAPTEDQRPDVDWSTPPWSAAQGALAWMGIAPPVGDLRPTTPLSPADAKVICDRMMYQFVNDAGILNWSSHMLKTAVEAVSIAVHGPAEPLVKSAWDFMIVRELDKTVYEFCRAFGGEIRAQSRGSERWDLRWMNVPVTPSQACLCYWTLAVKPELWQGELENATMRMLEGYPFTF